MILVSLGGHYKILQTGWLKELKFILAQFGMLEDKEPSVPGGSFPGLQTAAFLLCLHMAFPLLLCLERERKNEPVSSGVSYKDTNHHDSINFNYFLRGSISKYSYPGG